MGSAAGRRRALVAGPEPGLRQMWTAALDALDLAVSSDIGCQGELELALDRLEPELVIVAVGLPENWLQAVASSVGHASSPAILVIADQYRDSDFLGALQAGATGYLPGAGDIAALTRAAGSMLAGNVAVPPALVARLVEELRHCDGHRHIHRRDAADVELTMREWEVYFLSRQGLSTAEIARKTFVSKATVRSHKAAIARKFDLAARPVPG